MSVTVPAPRFRDYRLAYPAPAVAGTPLPVVLRIAPVGVMTLYARTAIVFRDGAYETGTYTYHRWATSPGNLVGDVLVRDFASSGLYRAVQQGSSLVPSDYELEAEVEEIEDRPEGGRCTAHLRLGATLSRVPASSGEAVIFQRTYEVDRPCDGAGPPALAAAMSEAMAALSAEVQEDVYRAIAAARAAASSGS